MTITINSAGASAFIAGNAGADVINVSGALQDNLSVLPETTPLKSSLVERSMEFRLRSSLEMVLTPSL